MLGRLTTYQNVSKAFQVYSMTAPLWRAKHRSGCRDSSGLAADWQTCQIAIRYLLLWRELVGSAKAILASRRVAAADLGKSLGKGRMQATLLVAHDNRKQDLANTWTAQRKAHRTEHDEGALWVRAYRCRLAYRRLPGFRTAADRPSSLDDCLPIIG